MLKIRQKFYFCKQNVKFLVVSLHKLLGEFNDHATFQQNLRQRNIGDHVRLYPVFRGHLALRVMVISYPKVIYKIFILPFQKFLENTRKSPKIPENPKYLKFRRKSLKILKNP